MNLNAKILKQNDDKSIQKNIKRIMYHDKIDVYSRNTSLFNTGKSVGLIHNIHRIWKKFMINLHKMKL